MDHPVIPWLTWQRRAWLYDIALKVSLVFAGYGIGDSNQWALIISAVGAILGVGVANYNTSVTEPRNAPEYAPPTVPAPEGE